MIWLCNFSIFFSFFKNGFFLIYRCLTQIRVFKHLLTVLGVIIKKNCPRSTLAFLNGWLGALGFLFLFICIVASKTNKFFFSLINFTDFSPFFMVHYKILILCLVNPLWIQALSSISKYKTHVKGNM